MGWTNGEQRRYRTFRSHIWMRQGGKGHLIAVFHTRFVSGKSADIISSIAKQTHHSALKLAHARSSSQFVARRGRIGRCAPANTAFDNIKSSIGYHLSATYSIEMVEVSNLMSNHFWQEGFIGRHEGHLVTVSIAFTVSGICTDIISSERFQTRHTALEQAQAFTTSHFIVKHGRLFMRSIADASFRDCCKTIAKHIAATNCRVEGDIGNLIRGNRREHGMLNSTHRNHITKTRSFAVCSKSTYIIGGGIGEVSHLTVIASYASTSQTYGIRQSRILIDAVTDTALCDRRSTIVGHVAFHRS